ncbi:hypothetical protein [Caulobacter mirabilis]|uniref:Uncharacterized protein n=1 Tax=Caulobacter mirabilis TaxID=69666 RepID=A0A2D2AUF4_9CAUL|nr:hypothetical protein [Caulobacter mirabilis]ATQ41595.1 hypothetical protein CSW64_03790 [Caulobacter mirabilis]
MASAFTERRFMGAWVFDLTDPRAARQLYETLPAPLKPACELRLGIDGGHVHAASDEAAEWLRKNAAA